MAAASSIPHVYAAIHAVMSDIGIDGIGKEQYNTGQKYNFRGIDDVMNALNPLLVKHKLLILPRVTKRTEEERKTTSGGRMGYVVVDVEFDFVSVLDGSKHTVATVGEAMDSADKATNKAMSAAYKYVCIQGFCIPTEGDNDADRHTHEIEPREQRVQQQTYQSSVTGPPARTAGVILAEWNLSRDCIEEAKETCKARNMLFSDMLVEADRCGVKPLPGEIGQVYTRFWDWLDSKYPIGHDDAGGQSAA